MPFSLASKTGKAASRSAGSSRVASRSNRAAASGFALRQAEKDLSHSRWAARPRSRTLRAWARTSSSTANDASGSKPRISFVARTSSSPSASAGAAGVLVVRCRSGDDGGQADERRSGIGTGRLDGGVEGLDVLFVLAAGGEVHVLNVPAVGGVAGGRVLTEGDGGVVLDRDPVVVPDHQQIRQFLGPRQR